MGLQIVPKGELENYIGTAGGTSDWFELDQSRINEFAEVTEDRQFIHIDEEAAAPQSSKNDVSIVFELFD